MGEQTELDDDLVAVVLAEALESLESALWTLRALDYGPQSAEVVTSLFRCFHSIKGNTAMAGRTSVSQLAHRVESVLDVIRSQCRPLTPTEGAQLIEIVDQLYPLIERDREAGDEAREATERALVRFETLLASGKEVPPPSEPLAESRPSPSESAPQTTRVPSPAVALEGDPEIATGGNKLRVDAQSIVDAMTVAGELFQIDERLKFLVGAVDSEAAAGKQDMAERWDGLNQISREFDAAIERLYSQLLDIQKVPVSQLASPLERAVRDICRKTGKDIRLQVVGKDLRIDKQVIQVLKDPLMHMVRNACDHGIELPEVRRGAGKSPTATVRLEFCDADDTVTVVLADDGRGLDLDRIREKAIQRGLVSPDAARELTEQEIIQFVFHPGFSTVDQVSELSGRGVGMDVVATSIAGAGGVLQTTTQRGKGTQFRIELAKLGSPVVDGLAVRSGEVVYVIPLKSVLHFVARRGFTVFRDPAGALSAMVHDRTYAVSRLPGETDPSNLRDPRTIGVLVEDRLGRRALVIVDEVLGRSRALVQEIRYDVCQKTRQLGVAILGDGSIGFTIAIEEFANQNLLLIDEEATSLEVPPETEELRCAS
jgi:two-component system, chemotaxis family, sensor kinase CheA